ncbi:MAG: tetratricopeptide repeat protein [Burkholderiales bacterium]|nr:tetratricopeptide repeat protein [Burkholderiales bacterium]
MPSFPNPQPILETGLDAHNRGDLETAMTAYRNVLAVSPDHPAALHLLGTALLQNEQPEQAVSYLERAARRQRDNPGVVGNLAQAYFTLGRFGEAHEAFRKAARLEPREVQFHLGAANSLAMQGKLAEAESALLRLTERFRKEPLVSFNLGNIMRDLGRHEEASAHYRKALELDPRFVDARNNLGSALHSLQRFEDAEREYRACVEIEPAHALALSNLASVLIDQGCFHEAEAVCRRLIELAPGWEVPHAYLASAVGHQGRLEEALACQHRVLEITPSDVKAVGAYAATLADAGRFAESARWFARALAADPESPTLRQSLFFTLLAGGRLADGWAEYHHRPAAMRFREKYAPLALSRTLPPEISGKHVCLLREQGLGDELFFLRYATRLHQMGARVTCSASDKIAGLLARADCFAEVVGQDIPPPRADIFMLMGDLPHALSAHPASELSVSSTESRAFLHDFPRHIAIFCPPVPDSLALQPLTAKTAEIRERLARAGSPPYIGITWRGGTPPREQKADTWLLHKEIPIPLLAEALRDAPGTFIGLQRRPGPGELEALSTALGRPVHDFTSLNEDLEGMLALLAQMDEYVGVSNTNMHLRAAAGKTARVLVPRPAEWRWMHSGSSSPWFPGFRVYRQSLRGDWRLALDALRRDLVQTHGR